MYFFFYTRVRLILKLDLIYMEFSFTKKIIFLVCNKYELFWIIFKSCTWIFKNLLTDVLMYPTHGIIHDNTVSFALTHCPFCNVTLVCLTYLPITNSKSHTNITHLAHTYQNKSKFDSLIASQWALIPAYRFMQFYTGIHF